MNYRRICVALVAGIAICSSLASSLVLTAASAAGSAYAAAPLDAALSVGSWTGTLGAIDPEVFTMALRATRCAVRAGTITRTPGTLTVIDYSRPSFAKRLWVFDLRARALLYHELVAHGQGSGDIWPTEFSNSADTHRSSIGLFVTDDTYTGRNGYSLRLNGLEDGVNDRARERAIVMHGAPYVSSEFVHQRGRLGRSWGCPALRPAVAREIIDRVKGGNVVFAYYPDRNWLHASKYLGNCDASTAAH